jgi:hypothetical protein
MLMSVHPDELLLLPAGMISVGIPQRQHRATARDGGVIDRGKKL